MYIVKNLTEFNLTQNENKGNNNIDKSVEAKLKRSIKIILNH